MPSAAEPALPQRRAERSPPSRSRATSAPKPETIRSYLQLKEGQPYDAAAADRSLKALFATGLFSDVTIDMQGSTLVVKVTENPIINRVAFEGNSKIEDDKLRDEVQSKPRQVFTRARVQADVERILTIYRRSGRYNASVEPKIIKLDQGRVDLVFEINEGDVTGVQRISFVGNEAFSDSTLRGKIRTSESAWYRFLSSDDRYDPDRLNLDRELLRKFYLTEGYADFRVVSAVAELAPNREGFFITFTINEGERYKFGKVEVSTRFQGLDVDVLQELPHDGGGRLVRRQRGREDRHRAVGPRGLAGLRLRRRPAQHPPQQGQPHGRRDLRHPGRAARLCRAHQHLGQHAHPRQGDPPRVPPRRGRRLQHRQGAPQPGAPDATSASSRRSTSRRRPARRPTRPTSRSRWSSRAPATSPSAPASRRRRASWATSRSRNAICSARARNCASACRSAP